VRPDLRAVAENDVAFYNGIRADIYIDADMRAGFDYRGGVDADPGGFQTRAARARAAAAVFII